MSKAIKVSCEAADVVDFRKIRAMQGGLKELSAENFQKLRGRILAKGITAPIHIWKSKGELFNLDGHQRVRVLGELEKEGFSIPKVPIVYVKAKNEKDAMEILLSNASQYGKVTGEGLYELIEQNGIKPEDLAAFAIPEIKLEAFKLEFYYDGPNETEKPRTTQTKEVAFSKFEHKCPRCGHEYDSKKK